MKIEDPHKLLSEARLAKWASDAGLPAPTVVRALPAHGRFLAYAMAFPDHRRRAPVMLRLDRIATPRGLALQNILAAQRTLAVLQDIPHRTYRPVPPTAFGPPGAWTTLPTGSTDGARLSGLKDEVWRQVAGDIGATMATLSDHPLATFGLRARAGRFVASRGTWREEWGAYVDALQAHNRSAGLDLGPLSKGLGRFIHDRLDALDEVSFHTLVHGELNAKALQYTLEGSQATLAAVDRWDLAMAGDPLVEARQLLLMPTVVAGEIVRGYGADRVDDWLEPASLARIEVYLGSLFLSRIAEVAQHFQATNGRGYLQALPRVRTLVEQVLAPGFVRRTLEAARADRSSAAKPPSDPGPAAADVALRLGLLYLAGDPPIAAPQSPPCMLGLAAILLAQQLGERGGFAAALPDLAMELMRTPRPGPCTGTQAIDDRAAWRTALTGDLVTATPSDRPAVGYSAWIVWWLGLACVDAAEGTVSDAVLRGLEALVRELIVAEERKPPGPLKLKLQQALSGTAALTALEGLVPDHAGELRGLGEHCLEGLRDLLDLSDPSAVSPTERLDVEALLPLLLDQAATPSQRVVRPIVVLALMTLDGRQTLPADAATWVRLTT
jgi:hypothetical protein